MLMNVNMEETAFFYLNDVKNIQIKNSWYSKNKAGKFGLFSINYKTKFAGDNPEIYFKN